MIMPQCIHYSDDYIRTCVLSAQLINFHYRGHEDTSMQSNHSASVVYVYCMVIWFWKLSFLSHSKEIFGNLWIFSRKKKPCVLSMFLVTKFGVLSAVKNWSFIFRSLFLSSYWLLRSFQVYLPDFFFLLL